MKKLFLLSFEGMNSDLIDTWIESGHLKNFKRLRQEGYLGNIKCSRIPYESSGIMSVLSGMSDSEHGQYSYWHVHNQDYIPKVHNGEDLKKYHFWQQEKFKEHRKGIVNIFGTHPAYDINGYLITYAMNRTLRYTYPVDFMRELSKKGLSYVQDMGAFYKNQGKEAFIHEVLKVEKMRHEVCKELLRKDLDMYVFNYTCIDRVCHFFMNELLDKTMDLKDKAVFNMYQYCDEILGDILEFVEKCNGELILFSSVGFGQLNHFVEINQYLAEKKLLKWSDNKRIPDWNKTIAFESVQGSHGININREHIYERGMVKDCEYDCLIKDVIRELEKMPNPYNDNPMFCKVVPGKEFYNSNIEAPDIVLEPFDWTYLPYGDTYWSDRVSRHSQTGWHRNESVWGRFGLSTVKEELSQVQELKDIFTQIQTIEGGQRG